MRPAVLNLTIYQGATFYKEFVYKTKNEDGSTIIKDLTGCNVRMQIRQNHVAPRPILDLTVAGFIRLVNAEEGVFAIDIPATETAKLNFKNEAVYDIEIEFTNGVVERVIEGTVEMSFEVTR